VIQRIGAILHSYVIILRPWLCMVAYLWILELQSVYGNYMESAMDGLADASAILWTVNLWVAIFAAFVSLSCLFLSPLSVRRVNEFVCRIGFLLVSAFYLLRWIARWPSLFGDGHVVLYIMISVTAGLYFLARRQRIRAVDAGADDLPSWRDCFGYAVLPLLIVSLLILGIRSAAFLSARHDISTAFSGSLTAHPRLAASSPNVIVIVADSLRARSLSLYSTGGVATPMIEQFGKSSSVYLDMHSNGTMTIPSLTALLTGKDLLHHGRLSRELPPYPSDQNLLQTLRRNGYTTMAVTSVLDASMSSLGFATGLSHGESIAFRFLTLGWLRDFGIYPTSFGRQVYQDLRMLIPWLGFPERTSPYGNVDDSLQRATTLITSARLPFFLFIHIREPHESNIMPSLPTLTRSLWSEWFDQKKTHVRPYSHYDSALQPEVELFKTEYRSSVRAVDTALGQFFDNLRRQPWFDASMVILTGDHGDSFERGYLYHGEELYENSTGVPLLIRFPGQKSGARVSGLTQTIDIAPTILKSLGMTIPDWMDGQSLDRDSVPAQVSTIALNYKHPDNHTNHALPTKLAIWWSRFKLITDCNERSVELYDLVDDPEEKVNLAARKRETVQKLKLKLSQRLAKQSGPIKLSCANL